MVLLKWGSWLSRFKNRCQCVILYFEWNYSKYFKVISPLVEPCVDLPTLEIQGHGNFAKNLPHSSGIGIDDCMGNLPVSSTPRVFITSVWFDAFYLFVTGRSIRSSQKLEVSTCGLKTAWPASCVSGMRLMSAVSNKWHMWQIYLAWNKSCIRKRVFFFSKDTNVCGSSIAVCTTCHLWARIFQISCQPAGLSNCMQHCENASVYHWAWPTGQKWHTVLCSIP